MRPVLPYPHSQLLWSTGRARWLLLELALVCLFSHALTSGEYSWPPRSAGRQAAVDSLSQVRKLRGDCLLAGGDAAGAIAEYEQLLQSKDLNPATRTQFLATLAIA